MRRRAARSPRSWSRKAARSRSAPCSARSRRTGRGAAAGAARPAAVPERTAPPAAEAAGANGHGALSPAVRKLLEEHGLDPATIAASGPKGNLTKGDVLAAVEAQAARQDGTRGRRAACGRRAGDRPKAGRRRRQRRSAEPSPAALRPAPGGGVIAARAGADAGAGSDRWPRRRRHRQRARPSPRRRRPRHPARASRRPSRARPRAARSGSR